MKNNSKQNKWKSDAYVEYWLARGTFINVFGLAVGLGLIYYRYPGLGVLFLIITLVLYGLMRVHVSSKRLKADETEIAKGADGEPPPVVDLNHKGRQTFDLTDYRAQLTFTRSKKGVNDPGSESSSPEAANEE